LPVGEYSPGQFIQWAFMLSFPVVRYMSLLLSQNRYYRELATVEDQDEALYALSALPALFMHINEPAPLTSEQIAALKGTTNLYNTLKSLALYLRDYRNHPTVYATAWPHANTLEQAQLFPSADIGQSTYLPAFMNEVVRTTIYHQLPWQFYIRVAEGCNVVHSRLPFSVGPSVTGEYGLYELQGYITEAHGGAAKTTVKFVGTEYIFTSENGLAPKVKTSLNNNRFTIKHAVLLAVVRIR
jgi:hypothetical protein